MAGGYAADDDLLSSVRGFNSGIGYWNLDGFSRPLGESTANTTAPPLMRYAVNPKDGCVEKLEDAQKPAQVPAVAAAALAAIEAAAGKNAFFPNFAERERERKSPEDASVPDA